MQDGEKLGEKIKLTGRGGGGVTKGKIYRKKCTETKAQS